MSLINDALKKARADADARAAQERASGGASADYRPPRAHLPRRSGWAPGLVAGLAIGLLVATAVGVGWWLGIGGEATTTRVADEAATLASSPSPTTDSPTAAADASNDPPQVAEIPATNPPPVAEAPSMPTASVSAETPPPARAEAEPDDTPDSPAPTPPEPAIGSTVEPPAPRVDPRPTEVAADAEPPAVDAAPAESPSTDASRTTPRPALIQPPEQVGQVDDNVYVLEARLGDLTLELDFIVWGATPFAQINGRQVEVDQAVDGGFLVDSIERQQVTLRHADGRMVVLRIR